MKTELAIPTSHPNLLQHLKQIHGLALSGTELQFLPSTMVAEIGEHVTHYQNAWDALAEQEAKLRQDRESFRPQIARLALVVRAAWRSQRARQKLDQLPLQLLDLYGIGPHASPNPGKNIEWIHHAQRLIAGEAAAIEAGFQPMKHPSLATLSQALIGTAEAELSLGQQMVDLNKSRTQTNSRAATAKILLRKVALSIHLAMFKESKPSRREVMGKFGYKFRSRTPQAKTAAAAVAEVEVAVGAEAQQLVAEQPKAQSSKPMVTSNLCQLSHHDNRLFGGKFHGHSKRLQLGYARSEVGRPPQSNFVGENHVKTGGITNKRIIFVTSAFLDSCFSAPCQLQRPILSTSHADDLLAPMTLSE